MEIFIFCIAVLAAYLLGSFPTSYLIAKYIKGIDIRSAGSGNAGATNVLRVVGKTPALITLVVDILKGAVTVAVIAPLTYPLLEDVLRKDFYFGFLAFAVIAGHIWPVFLKFKGGKGVATTLGVAIGSLPMALVPSLVVWLVFFLLTEYVSLASIMALLAFPVSVVFIDYSFYTVIFSVIICSIGIYKHRSNIKRLLKGEEHKTVIFKNKSIKTLL
ncbi:MAG: glycerol-3-phosphate 1-O-acyltransferase PlsY [Candidatus Omnitrophica bacterium]|nr:glycerol-3-phosphate 1-O-acyltransferase PlsY [Candidatus Omnitrophota bacterium]